VPGRAAGTRRPARRPAGTAGRGLCPRPAGGGEGSEQAVTALALSVQALLGAQGAITLGRGDLPSCL
jgi:hypothetical protein